MRFGLKIFLLSLVAGVLLTGLAACAEQAVYHSFSFGGLGGVGENQGIEILNYRYGNSNVPFTYPPRWQLKNGHIKQVANVYAKFPVGASLYVKWRVNSAGKVYEDTVDLKSRLPADMDHQRIHFLIKGSQLYVYVITNHGHKMDGTSCPVYLYRDFGCTEIYPEHWQNF